MWRGISASAANVETPGHWAGDAPSRLSGAPGLTVATTTATIVKHRTASVGQR
jgi:hypothetical protein